MPSLNDSVLKPGGGGPSATHRAAERGGQSLDRSRAGSGAQPSIHRPANVDLPKKSVSRPQQSRPAVKRSPPPASAFQKSSGGGRAHAASARGHKSGGARGGGGRGGGGGRRR